MTKKKHQSEIKPSGRTRSKDVVGWEECRKSLVTLFKIRKRGSISRNAMARDFKLHHKTIGDWLSGAYWPTPANQRKCVAWLAKKQKAKSNA